MEVVVRFALFFPRVAMDNQLFAEELGWEGVAEQVAKSVKEMVILVMPVCLPTHLYQTPH